MEMRDYVQGRVVVPKGIKFGDDNISDWVICNLEGTASLALCRFEFKTKLDVVLHQTFSRLFTTRREAKIALERILKQEGRENNELATEIIKVDKTIKRKKEIKPLSWSTWFWWRLLPCVIYLLIVCCVYGAAGMIEMYGMIMLYSLVGTTACVLYKYCGIWTTSTAAITLMLYQLI